MMDVKPKSHYFISKEIQNSTWYEIHINEQGQLFSEEADTTELNWSSWSSDSDDE